MEEDYFQHPADCPWHQDWHSCNCGLFNTITWVEPGEDGTPRERFCSGQEAAETMVRTASISGYKYSSYREAIDDFVAIHWGSKRIRKKKAK